MNNLVKSIGFVFSLDLKIVMADSIVPLSLQKKLRACMLCSLIKTQISFAQDGCENCEEVLHYKVCFKSAPSSQRLIFQYNMFKLTDYREIVIGLQNVLRGLLKEPLR